MKIRKLKDVPFPEEIEVAETSELNPKCPLPSNCKKKLARFLYKKHQYVIYIKKNDD